MHTRVIDNKASLIIEGKMIVHSTDDAKYQHKVELVLLVLAGLTPSFLSEYCSESKNTITSWVKAVTEKGYESLAIRKPTGRPPKLSHAQLEALKSMLEGDPSAYGYDVWEGKSVSHLVETKFGVKMSVRQCQRLFHTLGFSLQRPQTLPSKGDGQALREDFKKNDGEGKGSQSGDHLPG
ncbi:transposase [Sphaerochaeta halotolerans]|uniref:Transposase n=1 Tax=Sphaerochaeta halotolerans TaxID=2293840 RepID=A0A372MH52_9SPIR|nr:winged helix-turn-helix domain-containing protein [Sphaerochaeta halotolerans]RFU95064.1 transposase [Sphaerochaeta halotolerans]